MLPPNGRKMLPPDMILPFLAYATASSLWLKYLLRLSLSPRTWPSSPQKFWDRLQTWYGSVHEAEMHFWSLALFEGKSTVVPHINRTITGIGSPLGTALYSGIWEFLPDHQAKAFLVINPRHRQIPLKLSHLLCDCCINDQGMETPPCYVPCQQPRRVQFMHVMGWNSLGH